MAKTRMLFKIVGSTAPTMKQNDGSDPSIPNAYIWNVPTNVCEYIGYTGDNIADIPVKYIKSMVLKTRIIQPWTTIQLKLTPCWPSTNRLYGNRYDIPSLYAITVYGNPMVTANTFLPWANDEYEWTISDKSIQNRLMNRESFALGQYDAYWNGFYNAGNGFISFESSFAAFYTYQANLAADMEEMASNNEKDSNKDSLHDYATDGSDPVVFIDIEYTTKDTATIVTVDDEYIYKAGQSIKVRGIQDNAAGKTNHRLQASILTGVDDSGMDVWTDIGSTVRVSGSIS